MFKFLHRLLRGPGPSEPQWIETNELQRRLTANEALVLIDVRQPEEFTAPPGHLPGAINIPLADITNSITELAARKQPVVIVCQTDRRSARAAAELCTAGVRNVAVLRGGTAGWHQQGLVLELG